MECGIGSGVADEFAPMGRHAYHYAVALILQAGDDGGAVVQTLCASFIEAYSAYRHERLAVVVQLGGIRLAVEEAVLVGHLFYVGKQYFGIFRTHAAQIIHDAYGSAVFFCRIHGG